MMEDSIIQRLDRINAQLAEAARNSGRDPEDVRLLAVSKTKPIGDVNTAATAGQLDFGENYLQEAIEKIGATSALRWHYIGAIQSNKTGQIARNFDWVHTVCSLKVARRLADQRDPSRPLNMLLQINISGEESKAGLAPDELPQLLEQLDLPDHIRLRGLMAIPAPTDDKVSQRENFRSMRLLLEENRDRFSLESFDQLSMGMTRDFTVAIAEGATWIRIGTAIFGERN